MAFLMRLMGEIARGITDEEIKNAKGTAKPQE
jgi:Na+-transporting methylmalonyl-CoA/oxaloacetate decarboxylase gamma subunit